MVEILKDYLESAIASQVTNAAQEEEHGSEIICELSGNGLRLYRAFTCTLAVHKVLCNVTAFTHTHPLTDAIQGSIQEQLGVQRK